MQQQSFNPSSRSLQETFSSTPWQASGGAFTARPLLQVDAV
jgi:hypothetical protein